MDWGLLSHGSCFLMLPLWSSIITHPSMSLGDESSLFKLEFYMLRYHVQDNSYKNSYLTGSEVQSIIIRVGGWQHTGICGTGGAESSTSSSKGGQKTGFQAAKTSHTYFHKATSSNSATPWAKHIQTITTCSLMGDSPRLSETENLAHFQLKLFHILPFQHLT